PAPPAAGGCAAPPPPACDPPPVRGGRSAPPPPPPPADGTAHRPAGGDGGQRRPGPADALTQFGTGRVARVATRPPRLLVRLPVVGELEGHPEVGLLEHADDRLKVVLLLGADPELVALDLGLKAIGALVPYQLAARL